MMKTFGMTVVPFLHFYNSRLLQHRDWCAENMFVVTEQREKVFDAATEPAATRSSSKY